MQTTTHTYVRDIIRGICRMCTLLSRVLGPRNVLRRRASLGMKIELLYLDNYHLIELILHWYHVE